MTSTPKQLCLNHFSPSERWLLVALGTCLLALGISGDSLWIDEGYSAKLAMQPTLSAWATTLRSIPGSEPQMPGYQLYLWAWSHIFGLSEWSLRLANLPWALLFTGALAWASERLLQVRRVWLILCLSPFLWFYMNEARPYAMMIGLSMATIVAVLAYVQDPSRYRLAPWVAVLLLLALWSTHMLAITLLPSLLLLLYSLRPTSIKSMLRQWTAPILIALPLYLTLAIYFLHTVAGGKGGKIEKPGISNLGFAFYEFLGFGGLGPPRGILRLHPSLHTLLPYLPTLALGLLACAMLLLASMQESRTAAERRLLKGLGLSFAAGVGITFALAYAVHLSLLGRHLAVFPPFLALLLIVGLPRASDPRLRRVAISAWMVLCVAWSASDFKQRMLPNYHKDDYRSATTLAEQALANGEPVLWVADRETAKYYGLQTTLGLEKGDLLPAQPMEAISGVCSPERFQQALASQQRALVLITDREFFDPHGNCRTLLESLTGAQIASYPDFEAWQVNNTRPFAVSARMRPLAVKNDQTASAHVQ